MRVCLDARLTGFAGIGRFIVGLWDGLRREGADLVVLGPERAAIDHLGAAAAYEVPGPRVPVGPRPLLPVEQLTVPRLLRRHRIDVHHSPHLAVPYAARVPIVLTVHDLFMYKDPTMARSRAAGRYYRTVFPMAVRRATVVVGGSEYASRELREVLGVPATKIRTVECGLDHHRWQRPPPAVVDATLARFGVQAPYLLYVGTAKRHKNLVTLLTAYGQAPGLPPLVLAGPTAAELDAHAPTAPRRGVQLLGRVADEDLPALYAGARAVVLPSLYESVGFTALEAMACGIPLVSSDGGGLPDSVGDAGLLVPAIDVDAWTGALNRIVDDDALRATLVMRGRARAATRSWERAAREYLEIYSDVSVGGP